VEEEAEAVEKDRAADGGSAEGGEEDGGAGHVEGGSDARVVLGGDFFGQALNGGVKGFGGKDESHAKAENAGFDQADAEDDAGQEHGDCHREVDEEAAFLAEGEPEPKEGIAEFG